MIDVVAIGELLVDFAQKSTDNEGYPLMQAIPGGAPANFLSVLTKYGKNTAFIGKVGNDTFGHLLVKTLSNAGIDANGVVFDDKFFTTLAFVTFDERGDRSFSFSRKPGADTQLKFDEIDLSIIDRAKALHFGSLSLTTSPMRETTQQTVEYAKSKHKIITFDPNLRIPLWDDLSVAKEQMKWGIKQADFVKISDEEVEFLFDCSPDEGAKIILEQYGVSLVLLTLGPKGCIAMTKEAKAFSAPYPVVTIDTTGAGDICGGSAFYKVLTLGKELSSLTEKELLDVAKFSSTVASLSTRKHGGIPSIPELSEVKNIIF